MNKIDLKLWVPRPNSFNIFQPFVPWTRWAPLRWLWTPPNASVVASLHRFGPVVDLDGRRGRRGRLDRRLDRRFDLFDLFDLLSSVSLYSGADDGEGQWCPDRVEFAARWPGRHLQEVLGLTLQGSRTFRPWNQLCQARTSIRRTHTVQLEDNDGNTRRTMSHKIVYLNAAWWQSVSMCDWNMNCVNVWLEHEPSPDFYHLEEDDCSEGPQKPCVPRSDSLHIPLQALSSIWT